MTQEMYKVYYYTHNHEFVDTFNVVADGMLMAMKQAKDDIEQHYRIVFQKLAGVGHGN